MLSQTLQDFVVRHQLEITLYVMLKFQPSTLTEQDKYRYVLSDITLLKLAQQEHCL